jgi:hypothetical protein
MNSKGFTASTVRGNAVSMTDWSNILQVPAVPPRGWGWPTREFMQPPALPICRGEGCGGKLS